MYIEVVLMLTDVMISVVVTVVVTVLIKRFPAKESSEVVPLRVMWELLCVNKGIGPIDVADGEAVILKLKLPLACVVEAVPFTERIVLVPELEASIDPVETDEGSTGVEPFGTLPPPATPVNRTATSAFAFFEILPVVLLSRQFGLAPSV